MRNRNILLCTKKLSKAKKHLKRKLLEKLQERDIEFIVLAGYMRLIGPTLLQAYSHRRWLISILRFCLFFQGKMQLDKHLQAKVKINWCNNSFC